MSIVMLTHWHKTSQSAMQDAAKLIRTLDVPIAGLALTCVDIKAMTVLATPRAATASAPVTPNTTFSEERPGRDALTR